MKAKGAGEAATATAPRLQRTHHPLDQPPTFDDAGRRQLLLLGLFDWRVAHGLWSAEDSDKAEALEAEDTGEGHISATGDGARVSQRQGPGSGGRIARKEGEGYGKARKTGRASGLFYLIP